MSKKLVKRKVDSPASKNFTLDMNEYRTFQDSIQFGETVIAKWTNCGNYYQTEAQIVKINEMSIIVELLADYEGYAAGHKIKIAKYPNRRWSRNNGIFPSESKSKGISEEKSEYPFAIEKSYHRKRNIDIWILKTRPQYRLTRTSFLQLKEEVKLFEGYYSRFARGFVFETEPNQETLEDFAKTIEGLFEQERVKITEKPKINLRPLGDQTTQQFNYFRMFPYDLNDEYENRLKTLMESIKKFTGLDYEAYTPLILEAFNKYQEALKEFQQRKASANMKAPNPWMTGRSGYKNMRGKIEKAERTREIGFEKLENAQKKLEKVINHYRTIQHKEIITTDIDFTRDGLNKEVARLRKKYKGKIETIRIAYRGTSSNMRYVSYAIYYNGERIDLQLSENGRISYKNTVSRHATLREMIDQMEKIIIAVLTQKIHIPL